MKIQEALDRIVNEMKFGSSYGGYEDKWVKVTLGLPFGVWIPNIEARKRAVKVHDIYHLLTGYPPKNFMGEIEESFFELGAGCGRYYFAWFINGLVLPMFIISPKRFFNAFKRGFNSKSLYIQFDGLKNIYEMEVEELRDDLHIN